MKERALILACLVASASASFAPRASAAPPPAAARPKTLGDSLSGQAKADYDSARVLVGDGDYAGARIKFQSAFDVSKDPRLLWNIAASEKQLRHYAKAIELLKKYGADPSALVTAKDRDEAKELVKTLEPFTVAVTFEVSEPDADVEVDDALVGKTPLGAPIVIDIGQHKLRVHKETFRDYQTSTSIGGSAQQVITVKLEKELHEGKLSIAVPQGASVFVDGKPAAAGTVKDPAEMKLPSGGHTLRVTAPGMRTYEREVVLKDNETRSVEVLLERESEPERPKLRVGVGCIDAVPRGTEEGLSIFIDGSPAAATASGGKKSEGPDGKLEFVEFPVESGTHSVNVRITGCEPVTTDVNVTAVTGADIRGALRTDAGFVHRGPTGNPDWWRIGLAMWLPSANNELSNVKSANPGPSASGNSSNSSFQYRPRAVGVMLQPAINLRWATIGIDLGAGGGSADLADAKNAPLALLGTTPAVTWLRAGLRGGARIPLYFVAINLGISASIEDVGFSTLPTNFQPGPTTHGALGGWGSVDVQILCDWALFGGLSADGYLTKFIDFNSSSLSPVIGIALQPNRICRRERDTTYGLTNAAAPK